MTNFLFSAKISTSPLSDDFKGGTHFFQTFQLNFSWPTYFEKLGEFTSSHFLIGPLSSKAHSLYPKLHSANWQGGSLWDRLTLHCTFFFPLLTRPPCPLPNEHSLPHSPAKKCRNLTTGSLWIHWGWKEEQILDGTFVLKNEIRISSPCSDQAETVADGSLYWLALMQTILVPAAVKRIRHILLLEITFLWTVDHVILF